MSQTNGYRANASYTTTIRLRLTRRPGMLGRVITEIGRQKAAIGAVDLVDSSQDTVTRDVTVQVLNEAEGQRLAQRIGRLKGVTVVNVSDRTFLMHLGGKISVELKVPLKTRDDLSMAYTPGVARVCMAIHDNRDKAWALTIKRNTVAVVSDGTAVLGLGDIGPEAAMPVMEGKAMLFKQFGGVDAFPICLATKDVDEIVRTVQLLAPTFGGINLEDISAPRCFEIEERLKGLLDIPVFHDDQHGTAVVVLAALYNAVKIVRKPIEKLKVVVNGVGASGMAVTKIMLSAGVKNVIGFDRAGALYRGRAEHMNPSKEKYAQLTNPANFKGTVVEALKGADVFVGLSGKGLLKGADLKDMARDPIVFSLANPDPEIAPEEAAKHARIVATGRSDYPNQINNALAFPGIFRGALDARARQIDEAMKLAAAKAIASLVDPADLREDYIIPSIFDGRVARCVAEAVAAAATQRRAETNGAAHA